MVEQWASGTRPNVPDYIIKGGVEYRVISDQVGSPLLIVNVNTGAIAEQISYDAWGNITSDSNPGFQPFGFAGGLYDSDTGLVHFGARDYDPQTGRWISKDPVLFAGMDTDLYSYTLNDPVDYFDSNGQGPVAAIFGGLIGAGAGYVSGLIHGDTGSQLANDALTGAATGAIAGLTFGASLLVEATAGTAFRAASAAGIEALREESNYGCVNGSGVLAAGVSSVFADVAGSALEANLTKTGLSNSNVLVEQAPNINFGVSQALSGVTQVGQAFPNTGGGP